MGGVTGLGLDLFGEEDRIKAVLGFLQDPVAFEKVRNKDIKFNFFNLHTTSFFLFFYFF